MVFLSSLLVSLVFIDVSLVKTQKVYAGGVSDMESMLIPENSDQYRQSGGNGHIHGVPWSWMDFDQKKQFLSLFSGKSISLECGWSQQGQFIYCPDVFQENLNPPTVDFIVVNIMDGGNLAVPIRNVWKQAILTQQKIYTDHGLPPPKVFATFEYSNYAYLQGINLGDNLVSKRPDFQAIIQESCGINSFTLFYL